MYMTVVGYMTLFAAHAIYVTWAKLVGAWNSVISNDIFDTTIHSRHVPIVFYNMHTNLESVQNTMTLINRASKGRLVDVLEQFCIQNYRPEHTLIQKQITSENFMTHSYVTLLLELVLACLNWFLLLHWCFSHVPAA